jgi:hypothetical protein
VYERTATPEVTAVNRIVVVLTHAREIDALATGTGVGLGVGGGVGWAVGRGVGLGVGLGVGVGLGDGDGLGEGEGLADGVGDGLGLGLAVAGSVGDGVAVGLGVTTTATAELAGRVDGLEAWAGRNDVNARIARQATRRMIAESRHRR